MRKDSRGVPCGGGGPALERHHYICRVRLNGADAFVLWYQDDPDGFVRAPDGLLLAAASPDALTAAAEQVGISHVTNDPTFYDFDRLRAWCQRPTVEGVDCAAFLNAWNFFDDLAELHTAPDTEYAQLSRAAAECYDKLFRGNNLPSLTPPGEPFDPPWSPEDMVAMHRVFDAGLGAVAAELAGTTKERF